MSIQPQGENIRNTIKWISEERKYHPEKELKTIIEQASEKFNLSPKDSEFLTRFLSEEKAD